MTQQERIELLNRELKDLADLLAGMKECEQIPNVFIKMAHEKALHMADGFKQLGLTDEKPTESKSLIEKFFGATKEAEPAKPAEPVKVAEPVKPAEPVRAAEPVKPAEPVRPVETPKPTETIRVEPMPVKEAFSSVFKEFTDTPVSSAPKGDLRSMLTLNDRFLFQRTLFRGDIGMMNFTLDKLNGIPTKEEAVAFLQKEYAWEEEAAGVKEFMDLLDRYYTGAII